MRRDFSHIKSHSFNGNRYQIVWKKPSDKIHDGHCDPPDTKSKKIHIGPNMEEFDLLETAIHEGMHGCMFLIDEPHIEDSAESIAKLLWRMGFRLQK